MPLQSTTEGIRITSSCAPESAMELHSKLFMTAMTHRVEGRATCLLQGARPANAKQHEAEESPKQMEIKVVLPTCPVLVFLACGKFGRLFWKEVPIFLEKPVSTNQVSEAIICHRGIGGIRSSVEFKKGGGLGIFCNLKWLIPLQPNLLTWPCRFSCPT